MIASRKIYLDSNIFMYALEGHELYAGVLQQLFHYIASEQIAVYTSDLTLAECLVMPLKLANQPLADLYKMHLTSHAGLECLALSREVLMQAAQLRADLNIKLPDAIHVASALLSECDSLLTNDRGLRAPAHLKTLQLNDFLSG
ncbi:PIN domain-containing protein [uncultured Thiothrix sp.]|uniref:type II toxin-antitoxin system VapC family toxin n=1 Tax=uncultured Thiothrix sp. TaxID=223185 RepID=UPI0026123D06|nr:PIN domain-containing protein [uncultured Thiothrix sp.]